MGASAKRVKRDLNTIRYKTRERCDDHPRFLQFTTQFLGNNSYNALFVFIFKIFLDHLVMKLLFQLAILILLLNPICSFKYSLFALSKYYPTLYRSRLFSKLCLGEDTDITKTLMNRLLLKIV